MTVQPEHQVRWMLKAYIPLQCKTIRVGSSHWLRPPTPQCHVGYTKMLVSKNTKICITPNVNAKICVTPNANPQREQVEYRWRWVPNRRGWRWACRFHAVYFLFPRVGYRTQIQFPVDYGLKGCLSFKRGEEWLMGATHERQCTKQTEQPQHPILPV